MPEPWKTILALAIGLTACGVLVAMVVIFALDAIHDALVKRLARMMSSSQCGRHPGAK